MRKVWKCKFSLFVAEYLLNFFCLKITLEVGHEVALDQGS